jgi:hypothetical protein
VILPLPWLVLQRQIFLTTCGDVVEVATEKNPTFRIAVSGRITEISGKRVTDHRTIAG